MTSLDTQDYISVSKLYVKYKETSPLTQTIEGHGFKKQQTNGTFGSKFGSILHLNLNRLTKHLVLKEYIRSSDVGNDKGARTMKK